MDTVITKVALILIKLEPLMSLKIIPKLEFSNQANASICDDNGIFNNPKDI